jgi:hypothetical protein
MKKYVGILLMTGLLAACVTINIYFPAAEAQKAADKIIDDVWQIKDDDQAKDSKTEADQSTEPAKIETPAAE